MGPAILLRLDGCIYAVAIMRPAFRRDALPTIVARATDDQLRELAPWARDRATALDDVARDLDSGLLHWLLVDDNIVHADGDWVGRPTVRIRLDKGAGYLVPHTQVVSHLAAERADVVAAALVANGDRKRELNRLFSVSREPEELQRALAGLLSAGDLALFRLHAAARRLDEPKVTNLADLVRPRLPHQPTPGRHSPGRREDPDVVEPVALRLRLLGLHPLADEPYALTVGANVFEGRSDSEGMLEHELWPGATEAELELLERGECYRLTLQPLAAPNEQSGAAQRLGNLGLYRVPAFPVRAAELQRALRTFQSEHGLPATGELDGPTATALQEAHGS